MGTTVVQLRGGKGLTAAEQAFLAGQIAEPTQAALDAHLRAPALDAAEAVEATRVATEETRVATEQTRAAAQSVVDAGDEILGAVPDARAARDGAVVAAQLAVEAATTATAVVADASPKSGEMIDAYITPSASATGGASPLTANGRSTGLSIPAGSTGVNSAITSQIVFLPEEIALLVGRTLTFTTVYAASVALTTDKTLAGVGNVLRSTTGGSAVGTLISSVLAGGLLTRVFTYTVTPVDLAIGAQLVIAGSSSIANAHTAQIVSASWSVAGAGVDTAATIMADRAARLRRRASIGSVFDKLVKEIQIPNGAIERFANGERAGFTIPAGQTGSGALIQYRLRVPPEFSALLAGMSLRFSMGFTTNPEWNRTLPVTGQTLNATGTTRNSSRLLRNQQIGARRLIDVIIPVVGDEVQFQPLVQNTTAATSAQDDFIYLTDCAIDVVGPVNDVSLQAIGERAGQLLRVDPPTWGPVFQDASTFAVAKLDSSLIGTSGISMPAGGNADGSIIQMILPLLPNEVAGVAGRQIRARLYYRVNEEFGRSLTRTIQIRRADGTTRTAASVLTFYKQVGMLLILEVSFAMVAGDAVFQPIVTLGGGPSIAADSIQLIDARLWIERTPAFGFSSHEENRTIALNRATTRARLLASASVGSSASYAKIVEVKKDGTGHFTTITDALASILDASSTNKYLIRVYPGIYDEISIATKDDVDIAGTDRRLCWIRGYQTPDTSLTAVQNKSTIDLFTRSRISNFRITIQNGRYAIHCDDSRALNRAMFVTDCDIEHLGNDEVIAFRGSTAGVWSATNAWGSGTWSGESYTLRRCVVRGLNGGFGWHNQRDFADQSSVTLEHCEIVAKNAGTAAITLAPYGSGRSDTITLRENTLTGHIACLPTKWLSTNPANQLANRMEAVVAGSGNTHVPYVYDFPSSMALRIESASTTPSSAVAVTGSAVDILFGTALTDKGGGGLAGAVYGTWDVAEYATADRVAVDRATIRMGGRLGNRTTSPLTLSVVIDGGSPIVVTFDQDHTGQSNATVLAMINGALGGFAVASLMDVNERVRPVRFTDEEAVVQNTGTTAIRRKRAVAINADGRHRQMTNADSATLFAGIALENIPPGDFGRVKTVGVVRVSVDVERGDAGPFAVADTFSVGVDGRFLLGGPAPVLRAISAVDVRLAL